MTGPVASVIVESYLICTRSVALFAARELSVATMDSVVNWPLARPVMLDDQILSAVVDLVIGYDVVPALHVIDAMPLTSVHTTWIVVALPDTLVLSLTGDKSLRAGAVLSLSYLIPTVAVAALCAGEASVTVMVMVEFDPPARPLTVAI